MDILWGLDGLGDIQGLEGRKAWMDGWMECLSVCLALWCLEAGERWQWVECRQCCLVMGMSE